MAQRTREHFGQGNLKTDPATSVFINCPLDEDFAPLFDALVFATVVARMLKLLQTILRWSFSMRSEPADCAFLKPALPVTGRRLRPHVNPFQAPDYYSVAEERSMALDDIAHLPDRTGYLWLRTRSSEAIKVITREINMPQGDDLERAVREISHDPTVGMRLSRKEYERRIAERDREWLTHTPADSGDALEHEYRRRRKDAK